MNSRLRARLRDALRHMSWFSYVLTCACGSSTTSSPALDALTSAPPLEHAAVAIETGGRVAQPDEHAPDVSIDGRETRGVHPVCVGFDEPLDTFTLLDERLVVSGFQASRQHPGTAPLPPDLPWRRPFDRHLGQALVRSEDDRAVVVQALETFRVAGPDFETQVIDELTRELALTDRPRLDVLDRTDDADPPSAITGFVFVPEESRTAPSGVPRTPRRHGAHLTGPRAEPCCISGRPSLRRVRATRGGFGPLWRPASRRAGRCPPNRIRLFSQSATRLHADRRPAGRQSTRASFRSCLSARPSLTLRSNSVSIRTMLLGDAGLRSRIGLPADAYFGGVGRPRWASSTRRSSPCAPAVSPFTFGSLRTRGERPRAPTSAKSRAHCAPLRTTPRRGKAPVPARSRHAIAL